MSLRVTPSSIAFRTSPRPSASATEKNFRGPIPQPMRPLSTLRDPGCPRSPRKTRFRLAALPCRTGFEPARSLRTVSAHVGFTCHPPFRSLLGARRILKRCSHAWHRAAKSWMCAAIEPKLNLSLAPRPPRLPVKISKSGDADYFSATSTATSSEPSASATNASAAVPNFSARAMRRISA
jgi:hypothetical protein